MQTLTPQLINAGTICVNYPDSGAAQENIENLRRQFGDHVQSVRDICDDSVDARVFIRQTEAAVRMAMRQCDAAVKQSNSQVIRYINETMCDGFLVERDNCRRAN